MLLCQHCDIFPKMHIVSIQIGDVFIGVHRKLHERREFGRVFWPRPRRLHGRSSWLLKLLFFSRTLAGKHVSSQAATQGSPSQYGCPAEEPIEGGDPPAQVALRAQIPRPARGCAQKKTSSWSRSTSSRRRLAEQPRPRQECVEIICLGTGGKGGGVSPLSQHVVLDGGSFPAREASDTRTDTKTPQSNSSCQPSPCVKK